VGIHDGEGEIRIENKQLSEFLPSNLSWTHIAN
jgi:hypothetical protein